MFFSFFILTFASYVFSDERIIARVNDSNITSAELDLEISKIVPKTYFHKDMSGEKKKAVRLQAFENLKKREIIYTEAVIRGMLPDNEEVENRLNGAMKKFPDKKDFENALKNSGLTVDSFRKTIEKEMAEERLLKVEIDDKLVFTDEDLRKFYDSNKEKFFEPEKVRVFHIMIPVDPSSNAEERDKAKKLAEELAKRAKAGEDFSALATKYSKDAYRVKGGELGFIHRGRLEPEIEDIAFSLGEGEAGGPVKTMYGYSIVKAGERKAASPLSFDDAREKARKLLKDIRKKELMEGLMTLLFKKSRIEILDPEFKNE